MHHRDDHWVRQQQQSEVQHGTAQDCHPTLTHTPPHPPAAHYRYGEIAAQLPPTPGFRILSSLQIIVSVFGLAGMLADLQMTSAREDAKERRKSLLEAKLDGDIVMSLDRDGNGVDRIEYVIGMLTKMHVLQWSDVQPFLDQFDQMDADGSGHLDRKDLEYYAEQERRRREELNGAKRRVKNTVFASGRFHRAGKQRAAKEEGKV